MAQSGYLVSTAVTTVALLAVAGVLLRVRDWRHAGPSRRDAERAPLPGEWAVRRLQTDFRAWLLVFALLALALGGGVLLAVDGAVGTTTVVVGVVGVVGVYLVAGVYTMARSRGHAPARATAEALTTSGTLVLVGIVAQLLAAGGGA
jgi:hypothetical protein